MKFTKKFEAEAAAKTLRSSGHSVAVVQTLIKRMPAPYPNRYGWVLYIDGEVSA